MECLKSGLDIILKRSIQTSIVNSHTVTYKPIAPADNPAQLEFNCSGHSDYYIDLNSLRLLLSFKHVKTDGSDMSSDEANAVGCVNNLLHSCLVLLAFLYMVNRLLFMKQTTITGVSRKTFKLWF
jgi:hypothetical protein